MSRVHPEGVILVRHDLVHPPGGRGDAQSALLPRPGGGLLAVRGAHARHLHRQPGRLPHRGEDAGQRQEPRGAQQAVQD